MRRRSIHRCPGIPLPMVVICLTAAAVAASLASIAVKDLAAQATDSTSPPHRRHHALVYDPASRHVLLAGGQHLVSNSETPVLDDLWSWDGLRWTQVAASTGIPMITHKLFADTTGGLFAIISRGLVAHWGSQGWGVVVRDSLSRRESAAGAYDSDHQRYVFFGGLVGGRAYDTTGETWAFDGKQWTRIATTGPPPMLGGSMAYDTRRKVLVLFGGLDTLGHKLADTWELDRNHWTLVSRVGPPPRFGAGMAYDQQEGVTVLFGGVDSTNQKLNDTWLWDGREWRLAVAPLVPPARSEGYLAYDAARRVIVMFGGEGVAVVPTLGDTWEWSGARWRRVR